MNGPLFYNTIEPYLTTLSLPHTYGEYMAELREKKEEFTSKIKWYRTLFLALDERMMYKNSSKICLSNKQAAAPI